MEKPINPTTRSTHRYSIEFAISMTAYVVVLIVCIFLSPHANRTGRITLALISVIPVVLLFASIVRLSLSTDELQRKIMLASLALGGGITALLAATYGLFESFVVLQRPSAWWTFITFAYSSAVAVFFVRRHYLCKID
jgi:hypothetical protein